MPTRRHVEVRSMVTVNCKERRYNIYLNTPQELASHGLAVLIEELGTVQARQFILDELALYHDNYRGTGRDFRDAKMTRLNLPDGSTAHTMGYPWSADDRAALAARTASQKSSEPGGS